VVTGVVLAARVRTRVAPPACVPPGKVLVERDLPG
jgi:hypothetical protein